MPSALLPIRQDYAIGSGITRRMLRTELKFEQDRLNANINGTEVIIALEALKDMRALQMRFDIVSAIHNSEQFKVCYTDKKLGDTVFLVKPITLSWAEVKGHKGGKTWVLAALLNNDPKKEIQLIASNIRAIWDRLIIAVPVEETPVALVDMAG